MRFKALAIDLDGTLLTGDDIPADNIRAVRAARDRGGARWLAQGPSAGRSTPWPRRALRDLSVFRSDRPEASSTSRRRA